MPSSLYRVNAALVRRRVRPGWPLTIPSAASLSGPNAQPGGGIAFDGDSLTYGVGVGGPGPNAYPNQTVALLGTDYTNLINAGVAGQTLANMNSDAATEIDPLYSATRVNNFCCIWGGTNDIQGGVSGATAWSRYQTYIAARLAAGWKVVIFTMLPRIDVSPYPTVVAEMDDFNARIRAGYVAAGALLADVQADGRIGDIGDENSAYYDTDHIHMSASGYGVVASIAAEAIAHLFRVK